MLNETFAWLAALALLAAMGMLGVATLRRVAAFLDPLEHLAYGFPLGVVVTSLATLSLATAFGLSAELVMAIGLACAIGAALLWPKRQSGTALRSADRSGLLGAGGSPLASAVRIARSRLSLLPAIVIGGFIVRWAILWSGALTYDATGLWAGHVNIWGDWALHLGDTSSFAYGDNFPPQQPRLAGYPHAYHYLASLTAAMMVKLDLGAAAALPLHSFLFSVIVALGLYAFARRLTGDSGAATLTLVLFLLGGGLGWLLTVLEAAGSADPLWALLQQPWNERAQRVANFHWLNTYFAFILAQRGYLYGLPLALLIFALLLRGVQQRERRAFLLAGIVAGLLPLAHLSTLLALALITPSLFLLFPSRRWALFFGAWLAIAGPQLFLQQGGPGAVRALRLQLGWISGPDPWAWFWLKNVGLFLPLLGLALADRNLVPRPAGRLLWAFMPVFVLGNLFVFQPWDWDNTKVFVYWFLAACILVATLLTGIWRQHRLSVEHGMLEGIHAALVRGLVLGLVAVMILPGLLVNLNQLLGRDRHLLLTPEELQLAEAVRTQTPLHTVFAVGLQNNHPIPMLTGRQVVMGYPGWLWTAGFDYRERERDLRSIYGFAPDAPELLARYRVDYLVVGPFERREVAANLAAYQAHYPSIIRTVNYEVFDVSGTSRHIGSTASLEGS